MRGIAKQRMNVVRLDIDGGAVVVGFGRNGEETSSFVGENDDEGTSGVSRDVSVGSCVGDSDRPK